MTALSKPKRILEFIHGLNIGGAESFLTSMLNAVDKEKIIFDFAIQNPIITNKRLENLISQKGGNIIYLPPFPSKIISQRKALKNLILQGGYDAVHIHMNAAVNPAPLSLIKNFKGKVNFIIHSHNTSNGVGGKAAKCMHYLFRNFIKDCKNLACGSEAGKWMFKNQRFEVIPNAIEAKSLTFSIELRNAIRRELDIDGNTMVLGSIGRMAEAKNHLFMVDIFAAFLNSHPGTRLLLVGDGSLKPAIEQKIKDRGLEKNVILTGSRTDVGALLSAMDCFLFPSFYEGLPIAALEAQASGLPVIASDVIPREVNMSDLMSFSSLSAPIQDWINAIESALSAHPMESRHHNPIAGSIYDLNSAGKRIESILLDCVN